MSCSLKKSFVIAPSSLKVRLLVPEKLSRVPVLLPRGALIVMRYSHLCDIINVYKLQLWWLTMRLAMQAARRGRSNSGGVLCQATAPDQGYVATANVRIISSLVSVLVSGAERGRMDLCDSLTMPITPLSEISSSVPSTAPAPPVVLISSLVAHVG